MIAKTLHARRGTFPEQRAVLQLAADGGRYGGCESEVLGPVDRWSFGLSSGPERSNRVRSHRLVA